MRQAAKPQGGERLQKLLARAGVASRRKCEELILDGRVKVNGKKITEIGTKAFACDEICVDGKTLSNEEKVYVMLNKPAGVISSAIDNFSRKTVLQLVKVKERIFPVGRLDYDTSGLILLTNDGEWANKLMHPRNAVKKRYIAKVTGIPSEENLAAFRSGLLIEGRFTAPCEIRLVPGSKTSTWEIILKEGRNRQIRKMCEAIGHPVLSLERVSIGKLELGSLKPGKWRHLTKRELQETACKMPGKMRY